MKTVLRSFGALFLPLIDVLLPERERAARTRARSLHNFTLAPFQHSLLHARITTLLDYKNPEVSDLVRALKYERSNHAAEICAEILADFLREEIAVLRAFSPRPVILLPMPLHISRVRERGFNQMQKVFSRLPAEFSDGTLSRISSSSLARIKATPQQAKLSRNERLNNVSDAFVAIGSEVRGAHVILIDDVSTTGATLASAAKPLRKAGAKVSLIALARA